ncbi:MAG: hisN 1 [Planctomycetaceae bacterium]|nr:hisN 1 [Planctomycetaceae bacterium]
MSEFQQELHLALTAVRRASTVCTAIQAGISPETLSKQDKSPVTIADYSSQALICAALQSEFPADPVIGEEDAAELRRPDQAQFLEKVLIHLRNAGIHCDAEQVCDWIDRGGASDFQHRFWTLDPIDGTKGFLRREQYAVSLALIVDGQIVLGVLGCPNLPFNSVVGGTLFWAVRSGGAWMQPLDESLPPCRIHVAALQNRNDLRFCESVESGHSKQDTAATIAEKLGITAEPIRMDSQAKYGVVARGDAHIYLRLPTRADYREKIWDHAGGVIVVTEAGGIVTDVRGRPLDFTRGRELSTNQGVIVTTGGIHQEVVEAYRLAVGE